MSISQQSVNALAIALFCVCCTQAYVMRNEVEAGELAPELTNLEIKPFQIDEESLLSRNRRFVEGDQPKLNPNQQQKQQGWELKPNLQRNDKGTVRGDVSVQNHGKNHDFEATWGQNLRGPQKHSEQWSVGGSYRWP